MRAVEVSRQGFGSFRETTSQERETDREREREQEKDQTERITKRPGTEKMKIRETGWGK